MYLNEIKSKLDANGVVLPFTLTLFGDTSLILQGIKKVFLLSDECVRVKVKGNVLEIKGEKLCVSEMGKDYIILNGKLIGVNFA